jgi:tripartite motif-containing protein 71
MCVSLKHGLVIVVDDSTMQLHMHSLADGSLVRRVGSKGSGKGQFNSYWCGLCVSPDGDSVLVAEAHNNRVQQVRIVDGSWVRFVGEGVLKYPQFVDCNADVIAVSEPGCYRISVLSWADGSVRAQFGSEGSGRGQLDWPRGVRLLADGSGLVVADNNNHRLCVFTLSGEFVAEVGSREQGLNGPFDVLECASDGSFIVANRGHDLVKLSRDGAKVEVYGKKGDGNGEFTDPTALAALPDGGMVVREWHGARFQVFKGLVVRFEWITACAMFARAPTARLQVFGGPAR